MKRSVGEGVNTKLTGSETTQSDDVLTPRDHWPISTEQLSD